MPIISAPAQLMTFQVSAPARLKKQDVGGWVLSTIISLIPYHFLPSCGPTCIKYSAAVD